MDVIYILWLRQMKRYFRSRSRVLGAIGQPILFLLALHRIFGAGHYRSDASIQRRILGDPDLV
jgi:ABC-2 type transport system permease protein